ncbi:hypothetical protein U0070_013914, partial [Myodes glareolus]
MGASRLASARLPTHPPARPPRSSLRERAQQRGWDSCGQQLGHKPSVFGQVKESQGWGKWC